MLFQSHEWLIRTKKNKVKQSMNCKAMYALYVFMYAYLFH